MDEQSGGVRCNEIEARLNSMQADMLTNAQIDKVAKRAVELAFRQMYEEVGKSVLRKIVWAIGAGVFGLFVWLSSKGVDFK